MSRRKWTRRAAAVLAALLLGLGLEALQTATQPKQYTGETRVIRPAGVLPLGENGLEAGEEGASEEYTLPEETELPYLRLSFRKRVKADTEIVLETAKAGEDYRPENRVSGTAEAGSHSLELTPPAGSWSRVRLTLKGKLSLKEAEYAEAVEEPIAVEEPLKLWRAAVTAALLLAAGALLRALHAGKRTAAALRRGWAALTENPRRTALNAGIFALAGAAGFFGARALFCGGISAPLNPARGWFCAAAGLMAGCLGCFRKTLGKKPEVFFVIIALSCGSLMVWLCPGVTLTSWDDEYHYAQVVAASYLGEERLTRADVKQTMQGYLPDAAYEGPEAREAWMAEQDRHYAMGAEAVVPGALKWESLYEVFPGAGLYLGRVLGLRYQTMYRLARMLNLLTFTACGYFAMRRLRRGRMIAALALLIPTVLFLASMFSYDTGLTAFTALGLGICFGEWQKREEKLTWLNAGLMLGCLCFGMFAKAVYAPLMLIPLLLPKEKFRQRGEKTGISRKALILLDAGLTALLLASFMIPFLTGQMQGDSRGGMDVNLYEQLRYVLANPFRFIGIIARHLWSMVMQGSWDMKLTDYAYLGVGGGGALYAAVLCLAALTDGAFAVKPGRRLAALVIVLGTMAVPAAVMYLYYTPVGADTVAGAQIRYLYPFVFPLLTLLAPRTPAEWLEKHAPRKTGEAARAALNGALFAAAALILLNGVYGTVISRYMGV